MTYTLPHFAEHLADRLGRLQSAPRVTTGRPPIRRGIDHGKTRHTDAEVRDAVERVLEGAPMRVVAKSIGVSRSALSHWTRRSRRQDATRGLQAPAAPRTPPDACPAPVRPATGRKTRPVGSI